MSLIINMLKDLEKRQSNNQIPPIVTSHHRYSSSEDNRYLYKIALGIFIFIVTVIFSYLIMHQTSKTVLMPLPKLLAVDKTDEITNKDNEMWLTPASINGVSIETKDEETEITILLNHNTLYRLLGEDDSKALSVYIDNAKMDADLPTLTGSELGIKSISSTYVNNAQKFNISLKSGSFIKSVNIAKEDKSPAIVLTIGNTKPNAPEELISTTSNIKTPAMQSLIIEKYQSAVRLAEAGNKNQAIINLSKLLEYYPDYNDVRVSLAAIYLEAGNPVLARKIIDDGLALSSDYLPLIELKARVLTSEGKIKDALMVLQSEQPLISDAPGYHALLAALYSRENNHQLAADIYKKLVQINPHEGSWWFGLAVSLDKLGQNQDATYAYTKAATEGRLNAQALAFLQNRLQTLREQANA